jgi:hypothetical protein
MGQVMYRVVLALTSPVPWFAVFVSRLGILYPQTGYVRRLFVDADAKLLTGSLLGVRAHAMTFEPGRRLEDWILGICVVRGGSN